MNEVIATVLTTISYIIGMGSSYLKTKCMHIIADLIGRGFSMVAFLVLGAYDGLVSIGIGVLRGVAALRVEKSSMRAKWIAMSIVMIPNLVLRIFTWCGLPTILTMICCCINIYAYIGSKDAQQKRLLNIIGVPFSLSFVILIHNWASVVLECVGGTFLVHSYFLYRKKGDCHD